MTFLAREPLTLMISSRCTDAVPFGGRPQPMAVVRRAMKDALEAMRLADEPVFEVWIHEDESATAADQNAWDRCVSRARNADIFLVLYNGNAGWAGTSERLGDHVGICHAELEAAYNKTPSKVRTIQLPPTEAEPGSPSQRFQTYFKRQKLSGPQVQTGEEAVAWAGKLAVSALLDLARAGVGVGSKGSYFAGEALQWARLDYEHRRKVTTDTVVAYLKERSHGRKAGKAPNTVVMPVAGQPVAFVCDCIPATLSTAAARELVGQPFLRDHEISFALPKTTGGPVHVIACQKGVTEAQALRQLGFPDAVVVSAPFGVYVADDVQKIQMVFIANCRDETTTRHHVQRFLQWLDEQGEDRLLAQRARSRRRIADLIAREHADTSSVESAPRTKNR
jgi:hypothetical protein